MANRERGAANGGCWDALPSATAASRPQPRANSACHEKKGEVPAAGLVGRTPQCLSVDARLRTPGGAAGLDHSTWVDGELGYAPGGVCLPFKNAIAKP